MSPGVSPTTGSLNVMLTGIGDAAVGVPAVLVMTTDGGVVSTTTLAGDADTAETLPAISLAQGYSV